MPDLWGVRIRFSKAGARCALVAVALLGCASTAPSVATDEESPPPAEGIVIGKFGALPSELTGAIDRRLQITHIADGRKWNMPFVDSASTDGARTAPFFARLPAGKYRVTSWTLTFLRHDQYQQNETLEWEVAPGEVTCVGALYPVILSRPVRSAAAQVVRRRALLLPRDECVLLEAAFRSKAPRVKAPMRVRLAVNPACPSCLAAATAEEEAAAREHAAARTAWCRRASDQVVAKWDPVALWRTIDPGKYGPKDRLTIVKVGVRADGSMVDARIENPSGIDLFDQAALAAVKNAAPLTAPSPFTFRQSADGTTQFRLLLFFGVATQKRAVAVVGCGPRSGL